jgi:IS30 family transposase
VARGAKLPEDLIHRARIMRHDGMSCYAIAQELGVGHAAIHRNIRDISVIRKCKLCGGMFEANSSRHFFCSPQHQKKWRRIYG